MRPIDANDRVSNPIDTLPCADEGRCSIAEQHLEQGDISQEFFDRMQVVCPALVKWAMYGGVGGDFDMVPDCGINYGAFWCERNDLDRWADKIMEQKEGDQ